MKSSIVFFVVISAVALQVTADDAQLPGTKILEWSESELPDRLMDGAHRFVEGKIAQAFTHRDRFCPTAGQSAEQWTDTVASNRKQLGEILGVVESRLPSRMARTTPQTVPATELIAELHNGSDTTGIQQVLT